MGRIMDVVPIPRASGRRFLTRQLALNSTTSNKMSPEEWERFSGWCGHQHVPGNTDRFDPGAIDIEALLS